MDHELPNHRRPCETTPPDSEGGLGHEAIVTPIPLTRKLGARAIEGAAEDHEDNAQNQLTLERSEPIGYQSTTYQPTNETTILDIKQYKKRKWDRQAEEERDREWEAELDYELSDDIHFLPSTERRLCETVRSEFKEDVLPWESTRIELDETAQLQISVETVYEPGHLKVRCRFWAYDRKDAARLARMTAYNIADDPELPPLDNPECNIGYLD